MNSCGCIPFLLFALILGILLETLVKFSGCDDLPSHQGMDGDVFWWQCLVFDGALDFLEVVCGDGRRSTFLTNSVVQFGLEVNEFLEVVATQVETPDNAAHNEWPNFLDLGVNQDCQ